MRIRLYLLLLLGASGATSNSSPPTFLDFANFTATEAQIRNKCPSSSAFDKLKAGYAQIRANITEEFQLETILNEAESFRKRFLHDALLGYCDRRGWYRRATKKTLLALRNCLDPSEKSVIHLVNAVIEVVNEFICYEDGARAAMFVSEDGFECVLVKAEKMRTCLSNTIAIHPTLTIILEDYLSMSKCVVRTLDECDDVTAANMVHALMKRVHIFSSNYTATV
ncbi:27 kDa glycoprotein-like [Photinus pyralis]|uniref:Secreted protein n=2 Tax=Photinus pyralis TaxID=7054 RepID=A0A1Y1M104_PHOPY|nr:27 kDa glycoprotein-like [Photinus pyralis]